MTKRVYVEGDMYLVVGNKVYIYPQIGTCREVEKYELYFLAARGVRKDELQKILDLFKVVSE